MTIDNINPGKRFATPDGIEYVKVDGRVHAISDGNDVDANAFELSSGKLRRVRGDVDLLLLK